MPYPPVSLPRRVGIAAATFAVFALGTAAQRQPFMSDDTALIAYAITPEMERQFGSDSSSVSVFWDAWKTSRLSHAHLSPMREAAAAAKPIRDAFDAQMLAYAAYGAKGVYFLFDIIDDDYPGRLSSQSAWMYDVVDVLLDPHPSATLVEHPVSCLCDTTGASEISASMVQIQYACGADSADGRLDVNYFDAKDGRCNFQRLSRRFTVSEAAQKMGIVVRMVRAGSGRRLQEWLVPYAWFGSPGFSVRPAQGSRAALVINYNDVDTCDFLRPNIVKKLTWGGRGNPYGQKGAWADLEFGPPLSAAVGAGITKAKPGAHDAQNWGPPTPPMGWNPWNAFGTRFTEAIIKENADAMLSLGLQKAGYIYINLDGGGRRMQGAEKAVADYVRSRGFKFGVYGNHLPQYDIIGKEKQRVAQWVFWGAQYLKYDAYIIPLSDPTWIAMRDALKGTGIVYSVHCADDYVDASAPSIGHVWRTGPDILLHGDKPNFREVMRNAFLNNEAAELAGPGFWNDPDMLMVGIPEGLTIEEERTHFGLWCIMASPLLIGCDLRSISDSSLQILLNKEAIAVNQDPLGYQGRIVKRWPSNAVTVWLKKMHDGGAAVLAVNASGGPRTVGLEWSEWGITGVVRVRDIWNHAEIKAASQRYQASIPAHGSSFLRLWKATRGGGAPANAKATP